ncbi:hypothetical protein GWO43_26835 [candidate division KSB1 bacterium]|nr:hypothetical protein [candidate division KSB1 bacterium]NIR70174.1 hypothetical protein [candidate division KSB1 bacterium]NIS27560.1 hypothetical protein [candidate division KSB1 bacterium]NIT74413.1 hypothetical protein [candidate division KSB1 bacterium]NIU28278.1 hypothetical protein [candidate division KSB1 bacterium]
MISNLNLQLPKELSDKVGREAKENNISVDQYITYLLTKIISYDEARKELQTKFKKKDRLSAVSLLKKVPDVPPLKGDEI